MKNIFFGTSNEAKIKQVRGALSPAGITVEGVKDKSSLPEVIEDGKTASENARKKAVAYAKALGRTVFSMDNALYLEGLTTNEQPGLNVRRIKGASERPSDQELLKYYSELIDRLGGRVNGYWDFAICIASPEGIYEETVIKSARIFVSEPSSKVIEGYPLESIQIDPESGRPRSEFTQEEQDVFWQKVIGGPLLKFVQNVNL